MNWKDRFSGRLLSADEAVRQIRSGETISIAHVGSEPYALVDALARNADALTDVDMHFMLSLRKEEPHIAKGMEKHLRFFGYFLGGSTSRGQLRRAERNIRLAFSIFIPACSESVAAWMCF